MEEAVSRDSVVQTLRQGAQGPPPHSSPLSTCLFDPQACSLVGAQQLLGTGFLGRRGTKPVPAGKWVAARISVPNPPGTGEGCLSEAQFPQM